MKRVVQVSLGGRAFQLEEAGYEKLQAYLAEAETRLGHNPDKADILSDIEKSIADKCQTSLTGGKNVVTAASVMAALEKVGPVETETEDETTSFNSQKESAEHGRKLYSLPKEGKISGVCAGLARYFGVDVTVMRLLFVLLLFVTQGFMILIYIAMAFAMPEAKTPEQIAEAHGRALTAQEIVERVKQTADTNKDSVAKIGTIITLVGRFVIRIVALGCAVLFGLATIAWVWALWAIGLNTLEFTGELSTLNGWKQVVGITAVYAVIALPLFALVRSLDHVQKGKTEEAGARANIATGTVLSLFVLAAVTISVFFTSYAPAVRNYVDTHKGYLDIGKHHLCIDANKCGSGVQYLQQHPEYRDENPRIDRKYLQN